MVAPPPSDDKRPATSRRWALRVRLQKIVDDLLESGIRLEQAVREFERQFILAALEKSGGNRSRAARSLGVHRNTLRHKIHDHKLQG
ncbi:MAG: histidine kinase [Acidobacteria bacterium]|nr:MAG: histidine kinase [Acidobacteriota bacterium]